MATFDPQQTISTWAGILIEGANDGEHFTADFQEDQVMLHVGAQGFTTFVINANESAVITVRLAQKSPTNAKLSAAVAAKTVGPWLTKDLSDTTVVEGPQTMIAKHTPIKRGKEQIGTEWKFLVAKAKLVAGGDQ